VVYNKQRTKLGRHFIRSKHCQQESHHRKESINQTNKVRVGYGYPIFLAQIRILKRERQVYKFYLRYAKIRFIKNKPIVLG
jgi:hypothetical protein